MLRIPTDTRMQRFWVVALVLTGSMFSYSAVQHLAVRFHHDIPAVPVTAVDAPIPFLGWALIPYASLGPFLLLVAARLEPEHFRRLIRATLIVQAVAYTIFLVWPMTVPRTFTVDGAMDRFALWLLDASDLPVNTVPSLHVAYALLAAAACRRRWSTMWALLIVSSVMPVHQHLLLDVLTGAALGLIGWWLSRAATPADVRSTAGSGPTAGR